MHNDSRVVQPVARPVPLSCAPVNRVALAVTLVCAISVTARADEAARPVVGFRVKGDTKLQDATVGYLAHVQVGDLVTSADIGRLETALISSELFKTAKITLEDAPNGVLVVATVDDKMSWF